MPAQSDTNNERAVNVIIQLGGEVAGLKYMSLHAEGIGGTTDEEIVAWVLDVIDSAMDNRLKGFLGSGELYDRYKAKFVREYE